MVINRTLKICLLKIIFIRAFFFTSLSPKMPEAQIKILPVPTLDLCVLLATLLPRICAPYSE